MFQEMWYQKAIDAKRQDSDALLSHRGLKIFRWRNALYDIWRPMKTELLDLIKQIDDGKYYTTVLIILIHPVKMHVTSDHDHSFLSRDINLIKTFTGILYC